MRKHVGLAAILAIAAVARYWAIDFCLPALVCRPDEEAVASIATNFFARDFNPRFFDWPPVFMYAVALSMVPYFKFGKFSGGIRSEYRFLQSIAQDPSPVFLAARLISAAAGTASVGVVYLIGKRLFDRTTALIAAAFLALAYLHVRDSHFGVTDVTATFLALVVVWSATRMIDGVTLKWLAISGIATGVATATKYNAAAVALPVLWIVATNRHRGDRLIGWALAFGATAAITFLAVAPFTLIESAAFLRSLDAISTHLATGHGPDVGRGWWVHLSSSLRYGVGAPMLISGVAGLCLLLWRSPRAGMMLLLFPLATYVAIGNGRTAFARYAVPIVPFLCLGAAYAVTEFARFISTWLRRPQHPSLQPALAWSVAALVLAPSARSVWQFDRLLSIDDSRVIAARWIAEHYPDGATVGETEFRWHHLSFGGNSATAAPLLQTVVLTRESDDPDVIVIAESPLHPGELPPDDERLAHYARALETSNPERPGAAYDWQDEFHIPLAGINHLERPGPRIVVLTKR